MSHTIACPQRGAPVQLIKRFWLDSTDGPSKHLQTGCPSKHWLAPLAETIHREWPDPSGSGPGEAAELTGPDAAAGPGQQHRARYRRTMVRGHAHVPALWDR
jgi:hypothetical protein